MPPTYLKQRGKAGTWRFFRRVPDDVRPALDDLQFWEESLKTSDKREAEKLVRAKADETDAVIHKERDNLSGASRIRHLPEHEQGEFAEAGGLDGFKADVMGDVMQSQCGISKPMSY